MPSDKVVDEIIKAAMEKGEFNNLSGKGKPVDLKDYFSSPEENRVAFSLLKNAGFLPEELEALKEIETLKTQLKSTQEPNLLKELRKKLNEKMLSMNLMMEKYKPGKP